MNWLAVTRERWKLYAILAIFHFFAFGSSSIVEFRHPARIALAQIVGLDSDKRGNFHRMDIALKEARMLDANMVVFPEMITVGWVNPDAWNSSCTIPGCDSYAISALAVKYNIWILAGLGELEDENLFDSAILVDNNGNIVLKHRKINIIAHLMNPPYSPGHQVNVVETPFGVIGVLICADTFDSEVLKRMAALEPDILLVPYGWAGPPDYWPAHGQDLVDIICSASNQTGASTVGVDLVGQISHGPWYMYTYGGFSAACNSQEEVLYLGADRVSSLGIVDLLPK